MARVVNVAEAKTHLSRLLEDVSAGQEILLAKNGKPCAKLVPLSPARRRPLGFLSMSVPASFFDPLPEEEIAAFEGADSTPTERGDPRHRAKRRGRRRVR